MPDSPPVVIRLLTCPRCGGEIRLYLPAAAPPPALLDALAHWHARLGQAVWLRRDGHHHAGIALALTETAFFLLAGWERELSADDLEVLALFRDPAQGFDEGSRGIASPRLHPAKKGSGRRMTDAEICYRSWAAQASLAQINSSPLPARRAAGSADTVISVATHWVAQSPDAKRLGGVLSPPTVRNMRIRVTKNAANDLVARFARGIPPITAEKGTAEARAEAKWFLDQISSRDGQAFVAV